MQYKVHITPFAERYFIKRFKKKYKTKWDITLRSLIVEFSSIEKLFDTSLVEIISVSPDNSIKICKTEFKISGTDYSRHSSGCRCIIAVHHYDKRVFVLFVYSKTDISKSNETAGWKSIIRNNFSEYSCLLK